MRCEYPSNLLKVALTKALVPAQLHRLKPELGLVSTLVHMHMNRFIRFGTVEPNPITFEAQYGRH